VTSYDVVDSVRDEDTSELWRVYDEVFGDHEGIEAWRRRTWDAHVARAGFRLARAYDLVDEARRLVGFGYGYTGERGQWWTDRAAEVLEPAVAADWLGGHFEMVSLGVLRQARGRGVGRGLVRTLTEGLPHSRWLLMATSDADDPARHLYAREGWQVIGPGLRDDQAILGRQRPTGS
jgi:ribosomal protein S18 acetylase RimI-like enzyme